MNKNQLFTLTAMCGLLTLSSCSQEVINEELAMPNSNLTVITRSTGDAKVAYPVRLYVFDSTNKCKAMQTLESAEDVIGIRLVEGAYDVYAIGGADETRYVLPYIDNASKTSVISLQEGQTHGDLMAGHSTVTLSANGSNSLTIGLERKVLQVKSVVIKNVPEEAKAVCIKIAPIYESMLLNGRYQGTNNNSTITLTKQDDNTTWKMESDDNFLFPSIDKPTITVSIDNTSYSYTCEKELTANYRFNIEGNFNESPTGAPEVTLTGTITGAVWDGEKEISFDFGDKADDNDNNDKPSTDMPEAGSVYNGCFVLAVDGKNVTILSPTQKNNIYGIAENKKDQEKLAEIINNELAAWDQTISTNWRLMTKEEAEFIRSSITSINQESIGEIFRTDQSYLCIGDGTIYASTQNGFIEGAMAASYLRPVTTITIQ